MNVIPSGLSFNFLMPGMLMYIVCMLVFGFTGAFVMKMVSSKLIGIGVATGVLIGLYIASLLNH